MPSRNSDTLWNELPEVDISRSKFDLGHSHTTSFNVGDIIPIACEEVLPGDTFESKTHAVIRLSTPITPFMDNIEFDTYWFFVPNRLVWSHWREMNGENTSAPWTQTIEYNVPQLVAPAGGWTEGTLADYFGIPTKIPNLSVNALPFRGYAMIYNEWFRDENLCNPLSFSVGDATVTGVNTGNYITDVAKGGLPVKAAKLADRFTKALPEPQKGPDVTLPLGSVAPVYPRPQEISQTGSAMRLKNANGGEVPIPSVLTIGGASSAAYAVPGGSIPAGSVGVYPSNLYADLGNATAATINQIRLAFQIQKLYERDARGGTRYIELLRSHFGVVSPDARLQRPEYLGGTRVPIVVSQVVQTSESGVTPQGTTGAYSLTVDSNYDFQKSFTEHGFLFCLGVARYRHTYQQGLRPMWSRRDRFDYYWPVLANIGEQAVLNREIYAQGNSQDEEVFGFQEAWSEYRFVPNYVTGLMRSNATGSLDVWNLADNYTSLPKLSEEWIAEDKNNVDRVLNVTSAVSNQLIADFRFDLTAWRPLPAFSIPGLLDHH